MNSKGNDRSQAFDLSGWRSVLFTVAKWRWGVGLTIGYLASFIVPLAIWFDFSKKWPAAIMAAAVMAIMLSIIGKLLMWRSDSIRGTADFLHRANELCAGLGHSIDPAMIADARSRYSRFMQKAQQEEKNQIGYYEEDGNPSPYLFVTRLRESAWWTAQLAATAKGVIYAGSSIALIMSLSTIFANSVTERAYGIAVCTIILVDIFYLGFRYGKLETACSDSFRELNRLKDRRDLTAQQAVISAANYQIARGTGPLIPDWLWKWQQKPLQKAWESLSTVRHR